MNNLPLLSQPSFVSIVSLLASVGLPYLAGLVTKRSWPRQLKGLALLGLAFVKTVLEAVLAAIVAGVEFNIWTILYSTFVSFIVAVAAWFGILKNTKLAEAAQDALLKDDPEMDPDKALTESSST